MSTNQKQKKMSLLKDKIELSIEEAELATQKSLNSLPPIFKWILILGFLAIIPTYFIAKNISYKIWLNKYSTYLITAKPSFTNPKDPNVSEVNVTTAGNNIYSAVVKVKNENLDLSAKDILYKFNFLNSKKEIIYSESGKFYLLPDQTKYIAVPRFTTKENILYTEFTFDKSALKWQKKLNIPTVKITTSLPKSYEQLSPIAFVAEGDFTNQSPYYLKQLRLTFLLYNREGKIIGVSQRDEFTIAPFERRTYKQLWPNISESNIFAVKIFTDTNTLDTENISTESIPENSSSNLSRPQSQYPY